MNKPDSNHSLLDLLLFIATEDLIKETPREERLDTVYGIHAHQCGYDHRDRNRADEGCGFVWAHDGEVTRKVAEATSYDRLHTCPRCGAGPWKSLKHFNNLDDLQTLFNLTKDVHNGSI